MQKLLFLINPHAGKGEIKNHLLAIVDLFVKAGWEVTVRTTQERLEIPGLLEREAGNYGLIVACGGDGTLNETVAGLIRSGASTPLGYIPAGTVNDFASSLGIPKNMTQAARAILSGAPFACDAGVMGKRFFTYIAAFGAFTDVAYQTPQQAKNMLGRAAYLLEGVRRLPSIKVYHMTVEHDGGMTEGDFIFGMVTNSTSVGGFKITGRARVAMDDGLLELLLVRNPISPIETTQMINDILRQDLNSGYLVGLRAKSLKFTCAEEVPWTLDGEFGGALREAVIENRPHAFQILTAGE